LSVRIVAKQESSPAIWKPLKHRHYTLLLLVSLLFFPIIHIYIVFYLFIYIFIFFHFFLMFPYFCGNFLNSRSDLEFKEFQFFPTIIFQIIEIQCFFILMVFVLSTIIFQKKT
jgi:hypothetical protein